MSSASVPGSRPGPLFGALASLALGCCALADVGFRDAGELGTAGFGLGVAHPTGFAVDLLLLRAAALLPLGSIAFRQNLCVALGAGVALGLLAELCDVLARRAGVQDARLRWLGALVACAALGSWLTFAATALSVEVYSLALLAVLLAALCTAQGRARAGCLWLLAGLGVGLHVTAGLYTALLLAGVLLSLGLGGALRFARPRLPLLLAGALVVAYLPLASLRDPALDWGDPESFARVLAHLSAARIRDAYRGDMFTGDAGASLSVLSQLAELWPITPLAACALLALRRAPLVLLGPLALLCADLAYAVFVNPMGAADRQVGHVAGASLALLAGLGAALLCERLASSALLRWLAPLCAGALALALPLRLPRSELGDGYAAGELLGSGGPLAALPPRALLVCATDDACAGGLFALHVERVRPDVEVVPAQHLWDPTVLRRLRGVPDVGAAARVEPPPARRAITANALVRSWASAPRAPRPLRFESSELLRRAGYELPPLAAEAPYFRTQSETHAATLAQGLAAFDRSRRARLGERRPNGERAQFAWSRAYGALGEQALGRDGPTALRALRRAVELAPGRPAALINLAVALEATGDDAAAVALLERALDLAPERPAAWLSLARIHLRRGGPAAAREVLEIARRAGVRDARLERFARDLEAGRHPPLKR